MNRQILKYGLIPFLFGFLLLGAMRQPAGRHDRTAPVAQPAPAPHLSRALARQVDAATIVPLPVFVPQPDDAGCIGIRVCSWST